MLRSAALRVSEGAMMKHTVQAGIVSPFPMALDPAAVEFDEVQERAIGAVYAAGGAALWNGSVLSFVTDPAKAADLMIKFNEAWQASPVMAGMVSAQKAAESKAADDLAALLKEASKPGRGNGVAK
jgi:hypothetical protein